MFKFIFRIIGLILLLIFIGIGVLLYLGYENEELPYNEKPETTSIDVLAANSIYNSLDNIHSSNYQNNYLALELSVDDVNAIIIDMIRKVNPDYLINSQALVELAGTSINGLFFDIVNGNLSAKVYMTLIKFYKTNVEVEVAASIEGNTINLSFEDLRIGKDLSLNRKLALKLMQKFADSLPETEIIDYKTLTVSFDFSEYLAELSDNILINDLLIKGDYSLNAVADKLEVRMQTEHIFTGVQEIKKGSLTMPDSLDILSGTVIVDESMFNYLINEEIELDMSDFETVINIAGKDFEVSFDEFYLDLASLTIDTNLYLNECATKASLKINISEVMNSGDELETLKIQVVEATIGEVVFEDLETIIPEVLIPAETFSFELLTITDIEILSDTKEVKIVGKVK